MVSQPTYCNYIKINILVCLISKCNYQINTLDWITQPKYVLTTVRQYDEMIYYS